MYIACDFESVVVIMCRLLFAIRPVSVTLIVFNDPLAFVVFWVHVSRLNPRLLTEIYVTKYLT